MREWNRATIYRKTIGYFADQLVGQVSSIRHSGAMRSVRTRNLEIPGSRYARPGMTKRHFPAFAIFSILRASTAQ